MNYTVYVDDNYHHLDESERYTLGEFSSCAEAVAACQEIVDEFLESSFRPSMTAKELYEAYVGFGEDPFIVPADEKFSAWDYAKRRCHEICGEG